MRRAVRRAPTLALLLLLALGLLPACSGDDGGGGGGDGPGEAAVSAGLVLAQQLDDGTLVDALAVLDPQRPGEETIDLPEVARGIPAGVGLALYEQGREIVLVDAEAREVTELGVQIGDVDLAYSRSAVDQGGARYVVLLSPTGEGAALVDLDDAEATDLLGSLDGEALVLGAEMSEDGATLLLNADDGVHVLPTDDPGAIERLGEGAGQLLDDGSVLLTSTSGVTVRDLDSGEETPVSDEAGGALAVGGRVLVARGDEAVLVEPGSDEVLASAPFSTDGSGPVVLDQAVLLPGPDDTWTLVDGAEATAMPLPALDGLTPAFSGRPDRWVPMGDRDGRRLVALDAVDGEVVPILELADGEALVGLPALADAGSAALVSVDDGTDTRALLLDLDAGTTSDLGPGVQGAAFSPDGAQLAWSLGAAGELRVAPVEDPDAAEVLDEGLALPVWLNGG